MKTKQFNIKVYDMDGNFIHTYSPEIIVNDPYFSSEMNFGFGECLLILDKPFDDFDEGSKVTFENIVEVHEFDEDNMTGRLIYTGVCTKYVPTSELANQYVEMVLVGLVQFFSRDYFTNGSSFTVDYTSVLADPADMIKAVIDNILVTNPNCRISYSDGNIDDLGSTIGHSFIEQKWLKSVQTAFGFMGSGWWWKVDEEGQFWLKEKPTTATHTFEFTKHIDKSVVNKNKESLINSVHFKYSGGTIDVEDATSISTYGQHRSIVTDTSISDSTGATNSANQILADSKDPKISSTITLNTEYNLESIKVGETCKILGLKKDNTLFNDNMQIVRIDYKVDTAILHLEEITTVYGNAIENFTTNLIS